MPSEREAAPVSSMIGRMGGAAHPNVMDSTLLTTASLCQACQRGWQAKAKRGSHHEC